jgi:fructose-bisphosphate aldolase class I
VLALSGGYSRDEANARLRRNHGVVASFSRALVEGLTAQQSDVEFNARLDGAVQSIFEASTVKQVTSKPLGMKAAATGSNPPCGG